MFGTEPQQKTWVSTEGLLKLTDHQDWRLTAKIWTNVRDHGSSPFFEWLLHVFASGWETVRAFLLFRVGWGNNVQSHLHTMVMLRYEIVSSIWGGVGCGNNVQLHLHTMVMLRICCGAVFVFPFFGSRDHFRDSLVEIWLFRQDSLVETRLF